MWYGVSSERHNACMGEVTRELVTFRRVWEDCWAVVFAVAVGGQAGGAEGARLAGLVEVQGAGDVDGSVDKCGPINTLP